MSTGDKEMAVFGERERNMMVPSRVDGFMGSNALGLGHRGTEIRNEFVYQQSVQQRRTQTILQNPGVTTGLAGIPQLTSTIASVSRDVRAIYTTSIDVPHRIDELQTLRSEVERLRNAIEEKLDDLNRERGYSGYVDCTGRRTDEYGPRGIRRELYACDDILTRAENHLSTTGGPSYMNEYDRNY